MWPLNNPGIFFTAELRQICVPLPILAKGVCVCPALDLLGGFFFFAPLCKVYMISKEI
jgi:hypothetical protein